MKVCPNCKHTKFNVKISGYEYYNGETDSWHGVEVEGTSGETPFMCLNCEEFFEEEELEVVE